VFLAEISIERTLPCLAERGKIIIVGRPSRPLDEVLPYLAALPNVIAYNPDTHALTYRRQPGFLTLYPEQVYITQVTDGEEGLELLAALRDAVNATWENREAVTPVTTRQRAPGPLDVWALLPQTNCGDCGQPTCMAFAVALLQGRRGVSECPPIVSDAGMEDRRAALEAML
jgi:ArsR family metal-binding transcriptional regulator